MGVTKTVLFTVAVSSTAILIAPAARAVENQYLNQVANTAARYDELVARHPEAFADHAAEFWLDTGTDPHRALSLARRNLEVHQTPRAHDLFSRATRAVDDARAGVRR